jgi:hypothetical protein
MDELNPTLPAPVSSAPAPVATAPKVGLDSEEVQMLALQGKITALLEQGKRGANWFYWVAGLSLVNSTIMLTGGSTFFVVGLGATLVIDVIANTISLERPDLMNIVIAIAIVLDVAVAAMFAAFGWFAGKRYLLAFAIGMFLYLLDGLLFAYVGDWMSVGFHAFALFGMWSGFSAYRQLNQVERSLVNQSLYPESHS